MAKLELTAVFNSRVESIKADKEYENGSLVGAGNLVEGEGRLRQAAPATNDNHYLVSTVELNFGDDIKSYDYTNKAGSNMRAHQLEKGDTVTVEQKLHEAGLVAGDIVGVKDGKFAKDEAGAYKVDLVRTIGIKRAPAYQIIKIK